MRKPLTRAERIEKNIVDARRRVAKKSSARHGNSMGEGLIDRARHALGIGPKRTQEIVNGLTIHHVKGGDSAATLDSLRIAKANPERFFRREMTDAEYREWNRSTRVPILLASGRDKKGDKHVLWGDWGTGTWFHLVDGTQEGLRPYRELPHWMKEFGERPPGAIR